MLTAAEIRAQLTDAAEHITDDDTRATRAIAAGHRRQARRHRRRAVLGAAAVGICAVAIPALVSRSHDAAPAAPTAAAVACQPGRTVIATPRVAALSSGAVVTIDNETDDSVIVRLGPATAVVAPGVVEGQFPLSPGRHAVQCVTGTTATPAASIAVVAAHHG
jgi:hypothetical protein